MIERWRERGGGARESEENKAKHRAKREREREKVAGPGHWTSEKNSLEVTFVCYSRGLCLSIVCGSGHTKHPTLCAPTSTVEGDHTHTHTHNNTSSFKL